MNPDAKFISRTEMVDWEWDRNKKDWLRPNLDRNVLKELSRRSTINGLLRSGAFLALLIVSAMATVRIAQLNIWAAVPVVYVYYFLYGFIVALGHELQHKTVFAKSANWFSEIVFYLVQVLMWNSPRYARISHKLHHRYTMVRGVDPETDWPETITTPWLRRLLAGTILRILVVGAVYDLVRAVILQLRRVFGKPDRMMTDHCTEADIRAIRFESAAILLFHVAIVATAVVTRKWELVAFITIAWQIGGPIEFLWHATEHIGRPYNVRDHRLNTRSVRVGYFIKFIFWGLDDHVDHHLFPGVPSMNLPRLHKLLEGKLPRPEGLIACWKEMFQIAGKKTQDPECEFIPGEIS